VCVCVADVYSRPYGSPAVTPLDHALTAPTKPYEDGYGPVSPFVDADASPRRLRSVGSFVPAQTVGTIYVSAV